MFHIDKTALEAYIGFGYLLATTIMLIIGSSQGSWLHGAYLHTLSFRKPKVLRLSMGMWSLLFLMIAVVSGTAERHSEIFFFRFWCIPWCLAFSLVFAYLTGQQDITVDLDMQTCQETKGWIFHPRKTTYSLSEKSSVCIVYGEINSVFLIPGGGKDRWFILAQPFRNKDAPALAQEMADKLHLPLTKATWRTLRSLA